MTDSLFLWGIDLNEAVQVLQLENVHGSLPDNSQVTILFHYHCTDRCCTINRCLLTIPVEEQEKARFYG